MTEYTLSPETLVELLRRGLRVGIPPTALANMFEMEPEVVQELAVNVRRGRYGTAELSEALSFLTWEAYEQTLLVARKGSPELKLKANMAIMGKALATSARQTPEELERARADFLAFIAESKIIEIEGEEVEPSAFVAVDDEADDQGQGL
jgi:hypothetical protein